jgi:hypothetical protein
MIALPTSLVVAQWVVTAALGVILIIAYRQLAFFLNIEGKVRDAEGLPVGVTIPAFEYVSVKGERRHFATGNMPVALLVADPLCVTCEGALVAMERVLDKTRYSRIRGLVLTSATRTAIDSVPHFRDTQLEVGLVRPEVLTDVLQTVATPYTYMVDGDGVVTSGGIAADEVGVEKLITLASDHSGSTPLLPVDGLRRAAH